MKPTFQYNYNFLREELVTLVQNVYDADLIRYLEFSNFPTDEDYSLVLSLCLFEIIHDNLSWIIYIDLNNEKVDLKDRNGNYDTINLSELSTDNLFLIAKELYDNGFVYCKNIKL